MTQDEITARTLVSKILSIYPMGIISNGEPKQRLVLAIADALEKEREQCAILADAMRMSTSSNIAQAIRYRTKL